MCAVPGKKVGMVLSKTQGTVRHRQTTTIEISIVDYPVYQISITQLMNLLVLKNLIA